MMRLDLRDIIHTPGERRDFDYDLDMAKIRIYGERPFSRPIHVTGSVRNMAGALELDGTAETVLDTRCDRCLKHLDVPYSVPVNCLLAEELEDEENDEIVLLENGEVDLDDIFSTACILNLDGRHLCSPECKGLCPTCGKDLNEGPCDCKKELDPRFAVLAKLLDKDTTQSENKA